MAMKTKAVRLLESDDAVLGLLAAALRRSRNDVVHEALSEYLLNHRDEFSQFISETQKALAAADIDALARLAAPSMEREVDELVAGLPAR